MRKNWTDGRLDDLNDKVDRGFKRVDGDIGTLRTEVRAEFAALHRLIIQVGGGLIGTIVVSFAGLIATQL